MIYTFYNYCHCHWNPMIIIWYLTRNPRRFGLRGLLILFVRNYYSTIACWTATVTATVAPTIGLFPIPRTPIISTCTDTDEGPANCASECIRSRVYVIPTFRGHLNTKLQLSIVDKKMSYAELTFFLAHCRKVHIFTLLSLINSVLFDLSPKNPNKIWSELIKHYICEN